jgi:hypothetical protein
MAYGVRQGFRRNAAARAVGARPTFALKKSEIVKYTSHFKSRS